MQICLNSPLPSFDSIMASFKPLMTWPPKFPAFPSLPKMMFPSLPSPLFPSFHVPNFELMLHALELQAFQLQTTIFGMIKPMLDKLGIAISSFLPKIPGLPNLNLLDLLSGSVDKIIAAVKAAIANGFHLPGLPSPLFATLKIPEFEVIQTMQILISNYMGMVARLIPDLIGQITKKFKLPGLPAMPTLPSIGDIIAKIPSVPDIKAKIMDALGNFDIMGFMSKITFPGLPALPSIPLPMMFSFKMPDIEFNLSLNLLYNHLTTGFLKPIMDFLLKTVSKVVSFTFPKLCANIPVPETPAIPAIEIPQVKIPPIK